MKIAFVTLSLEGTRLFEKLCHKFQSADYFVHEKVNTSFKAEKFSATVDLVRKQFSSYGGFVFIAPVGAVIRALNGNIKNKKSDPAVVQIDIGGRYVVSLLSGHEGGANNLAIMAANAIGAEPVISTSTEAKKNIIVGVGCKKGKSSNDIEEAILASVKEAGVALEKVRLIASADIKKEEKGLIDAAEKLGIPLRFISSEEIRNSTRGFTRSEFVEKMVNLPAVAEPAALLAGRRTSLILPRKKCHEITVAIAKENCLSLE